MEAAMTPVLSPTRNFALALLLPAAFLVGSGAAPRAAVAQQRGQQCFNVSSINSFSPAGRDKVDVRVGANRYYRLDLLGTCPDVDYSFRVAVRTRGGSSWICQGQDADLIVPDPSGTQTCPVTGVRELTPEEVATLYGPHSRHRH
jgi:Family of unknown function (DUF6491)